MAGPDEELNELVVVVPIPPVLVPKELVPITVLFPGVVLEVWLLSPITPACPVLDTTVAVLLVLMVTVLDPDDPTDSFIEHVPVAGAEIAELILTLLLPSVA